MGKPTKLTGEQRSILLTWLAAEYDTRLIRQWFKARHWPEISDQLIYYYRWSRGAAIERLRTERRDNAIRSGVALKEERIARLAAHADELEAIKWEPDEHGRLWNEKAWRETLDDIAKETGDRKQAVMIEDVTKRDDSELIREFESLVDTARARAGADTGGGTEAAGAGSIGGQSPA